MISNPTTILKNNQNDLVFYNKMIYADNLISKINEINSKYTKNVINKQMLNQINEALLKGNTEFRPNFIQQYNLNESHFIKGIECGHCGSFSMIRAYKTWKCNTCFHSNPTAHVRPLLDYFLLYKPTITNSECRNYLQLDSLKNAYTILNSIGLTYTGKNKARKYHAPKLVDYPQNSFAPNKKKVIL
ncbi:hypothetical protein CWR45_03920 [Oceanobacillus chungangensis]|uniref:NERD domain-containing protein n=1 Tax=Oceanobacillus chungangensis TaxID=1229152 RepID=A0A3D8PWB7_9BACI|nr:hypothetical protein CWR45_03920 [Oceanobacillus chungangensis]